MKFRLMRRNRLGALVDVPHPLIRGVDGFYMYSTSAELAEKTAASIGAHGCIAVEIDENDRPVRAERVLN